MKNNFCAGSYQKGSEKETAKIITYINFLYIAITKIKTNTN